MDGNSGQGGFLNPTDEETLKADARLQEFCDLIGAIEKQPDAERRFARVKRMLTVVAEASDDEVTAAQKLGEAFAVIEEFSDYLPAKVYRDIADAVNDFVSDAQWTSDPELCRRILPLLIAKVINAKDLVSA